MMRSDVATVYVRMMWTRQFGEDVTIAAMRSVAEKRLSAREALEILDARQNEEGVRVARVFLLRGTRVRTVCRRCGHIVYAEVGRREIHITGRAVASMAIAQRIAIDECPCSRRRESKFGPQGRPILKFWETEIEGRWWRLEVLRMPGD